MQGDLPEMNHSHLPEYITKQIHQQNQYGSITKTAALCLAHHYEKKPYNTLLEKRVYSMGGKKERSGKY
ncbi:hypothetical protein J4731_02930 [Providencia rettgeri]|nr:hypothetical protein [Providencia rettgeri]